MTWRAAYQLIRKKGELLEENYQEDGIFVRAYIPESIYEASIVPGEKSLKYGHLQ